MNRLHANNKKSATDQSNAHQPKKHARTTPNERNIIEGDVLDIMRALPETMTFDLVIADPPYNIGKDFGNNTDSLSIEDYVTWTKQWIDLCLDRLSHNGLIYIYGFAEVLAHIAVQYPMHAQRWLAWHYTNKSVPASKFWQRSHESILCLWKTDRERPTLEIDQIREPYTQHFIRNAAGRKRIATPSRFGGNRGKETRYEAHKNGALPRDVIKIPALAGGAGASERWFMCRECGHTLCPPSELKKHRGHDILKHPTQKPFALTRRLIRSRINGKGGRILIPFAGSGSECVVANSLGIPYLGIEMNPEYVDFARKWLRVKMKT